MIRERVIGGLGTLTRLFVSVRAPTISHGRHFMLWHIRSPSGLRLQSSQDLPVSSQRSLRTSDEDCDLAERGRDSVLK